MMTRRDAAVLAFKLLALWVLVGAIRDVLSVVQIVLDNPPDYWRRAALLPLISTLIWIGIGTSLWFRAASLCTRVFPEEDPWSAATPPATGEELRALAFSVVGLVLMVQALPELVGALIHYIVNNDGWVFYPSSDLIHGGVLAAAAAVRLVLGAGLFLGAPRLRRALATVRTAVAGPRSLEDNGDAVVQPKPTPQP